MGMLRPDPMDRGAEYRNVIGIPGGTASPLYSTVTAANTHGMRLAAGSGHNDDVIGTVWIADSNTHPFFRGEQYHQFHSNFFGGAYPVSYKQTLWQLQITLGKIPLTGCPQGSHW